MKINGEVRATDWKRSKGTMEALQATDGGSGNWALLWRLMNGGAERNYETFDTKCKSNSNLSSQTDVPAIDVSNDYQKCVAQYRDVLSWAWRCYSCCHCHREFFCERFPLPSPPIPAILLDRVWQWWTGLREGKNVNVSISHFANMETQTTKVTCGKNDVYYSTNWTSYANWVDPHCIRLSTNSSGGISIEMKVHFRPED